MGQANDDLSALLDEVRPESRPWAHHTTTCVVFHPSGCSICRAYVKHVVDAHRRDDPLLQSALDAIRDVWFKRFDEDPITRRNYDDAFQEGIARGRREAKEGRKRRESSPESSGSTSRLREKAKSSRRTDKGKSKRSAEDELAELREEHARLNSRYVAMVESRDELARQLEVSETERARLASIMQHQQMQSPAAAGPSQPQRPLVNYGDISMDDIGTDMSYAGVAGIPPPPEQMAGPSRSGIAKRKASDPIQSEPKKPRPVVDVRVGGLPAPLGKGGNPYIPGGAWSTLMTITEGRNEIDKIRRAATQRWRSEWRGALEEVRGLRSLSYDALGHAQKLMLKLAQTGPSLEEQARANRSVVPSNVRWDGEQPNEADLEIWGFMKRLYGKGDRRAIKTSFTSVVFDDSLWDNGPQLQSRGLVEAPYPHPTVDDTLMYNHLVSRCGVTRTEVITILRPYLLRGTVASTFATQGAGVPNPSSTSSTVPSTGAASSAPTAPPMMATSPIVQPAPAPSPQAGDDAADSAMEEPESSHESDHSTPQH